MSIPILQQSGKPSRDYKLIQTGGAEILQALLNMQPVREH